MGRIINFKVLPNNKILYRILLEQEEVLALKNAIENIHLFAADLCLKKAQIIDRGKNRSTKYFTIPFELKFRKKKSHREISYQKLEIGTKIFFIYVIHKHPLY